MSRRLVVGTLVFMLGFTVACTDDNETAEADPTEACLALADLGEDILGTQDVTTPSEVRAAVEGALEEFVDAAAASGDDRLEVLARSASDYFEIYLTGSSFDAAEAGQHFDATIDRAGGRCLELGATNPFPEELDD